MRYTTNVRISFSLEPYYNRGVTPEAARTAIESISLDDGWGSRLRCSPTYFNENWSVEVPHDSMVPLVVTLVEIQMERLANALAAVGEG
jgi:hypothetical protein